MATAAVSAHGTLFKVGDGGTPENFATVAEAKSISGPTFDSTVIDVTSQDSASHVKEKIQGLLDSGDVTFECNWIPSNATQSSTTGLMYLHQNRIQRNMRLVIPTSPTLTANFRGFVKSIQPGFDIDGAVIINVNVTITGPVTWS